MKWLCQGVRPHCCGFAGINHSYSLGKSLHSWPVQPLPARLIPDPGERGREDALSTFPGLFKGHREGRAMCHRSYEPDLSGLVPCLFMKDGRFPVSCFPGVILNSQPFVPRHRPALGTASPAPAPHFSQGASSPVQSRAGSGWVHVST